MSTTDSSEKNQPTRSNRVIWIVLAICVLPVFASTALYLLWKPSNFVNHGELIEPTALAELSFPRSEGQAFTFKQLEGRWALVTVDSADCDDYCNRKLYLMRQIRLTQGKDADRVERVWFITDGRSPAAATTAKYEGTIQVPLANAAQLAVFPAKLDAREHIYVVDHLGNLMMRYSRDVDPSLMKKDIAKLLRISSGWRRTER